MKNGAIQGRYVDIFNRYLVSEGWMCFITSSYWQEARSKGMPAAWQSLDFAYMSDYSLVIPKRASHPNAAKLVAIYLASPAGARFMLEEGGAGNLSYPGNYEHDIRLEAERQLIPEVFALRDTKVLEFQISDESFQWEKEVELILIGKG